ncbi:transcriptional activator Myb-like [Rhizophagus irregularis DAOM 181602=DAOM 197198]|nr:transcriptional activator Myb-like [Rhizophagus irregularis DAOM 181602=DAOM 197198]
MSDNLTIIKGPWNNLEDEKIRREVERYKTHYPNQQISWKFIEEAIQNRTAKQCRERWTNHLNNVNKAPLTVEEERLILQLREDDPNIKKELRQRNLS